MTAAALLRPPRRRRRAVAAAWAALAPLTRLPLRRHGRAAPRQAPPAPCPPLALLPAPCLPPAGQILGWPCLPCWPPPWPLHQPPLPWHAPRRTAAGFARPPKQGGGRASGPCLARLRRRWQPAWARTAAPLPAEAAELAVPQRQRPVRLLCVAVPPAAWPPAAAPQLAFAACEVVPRAWGLLPRPLPACLRRLPVRGAADGARLPWRGAGVPSGRAWLRQELRRAAAPAAAAAALPEERALLLRPPPPPGPPPPPPPPALPLHLLGCLPCLPSACLLCPRLPPPPLRAPSPTAAGRAPWGRPGGARASGPWRQRRRRLQGSQTAGPTWMAAWQAEAWAAAAAAAAAAWQAAPAAPVLAPPPLAQLPAHPWRALAPSAAAPEGRAGLVKGEGFNRGASNQPYHRSLGDWQALSRLAAFTTGTSN